VKLGIVYHMPFWRAADGTLREVEGSFARYVDSLAPYFDEITLCVPVLAAPRGDGTAIRSANVRLARLPPFDGPLQFYPRLPQMIVSLFRFVRDIDVLHCRVPTPAAVFADAMARLLGRPSFVLIVGDLQALLPSMPYRGIKQRLWCIYTAFEERNVQRMAERSLAFANGAALTSKHSNSTRAVIQTQTTTISTADIGDRIDTFSGPSHRLLTVSRIDPRKNLRVLPEMMRQLSARGGAVSLDIIGPPVGAPGEAERAGIERDAAATGAAVRLLGPVPLDQLLNRYAEYDAFVLPTGPGEGVPRVLLEAMASGLPVVTTKVAGIPSLITHEINGLLVEPTAASLAAAVGRVIADPALRRRLIANGYDTARAYTLEAQAQRMMQSVSAHLRIALHPVEGGPHETASMTARRKICFVLPSLNGGGAERAAVHILNSLDAGAWERSMYLFRREGAYLDKVESAIALSAGHSDSRIGRWRELRRFLRASRPDVVVSFLSYFSVLAATRAAGIGARVVFNQQTPMTAFLHDADYHWRRPWHRRLFSAVTRVGYGLADRIVTTSKGVADDLVSQFGVASARIQVIHNPVDLAQIARASTEPIDPAFARDWMPPVIVAAGRLAHAKNYPLLIDAMAALRERVPARLFVLGAGDLERELRERIAERHLESAVVLCGFQDNPWKYVARADVFALTSRYEGFGNVLVEAMACGVPVVATNSPGTREIVTDDINGLLVDRHEPTQVAAALERLLTDEALHRRLSAGARASAERFSLPAIAAAYDRAFEAVLA
jgi:glycosyltransferase involved in cell wall biosynthesis